MKKDSEGRKVFLEISFICSMEYWVCFWCCKTRGKVVSIETKLSYEKIEMAACVVDVRGIVFVVV